MVDRSEETRLRAEEKFKKKERQTEEGEKVWAEHLAAGSAADAHRAKLKALRLAKEAGEGHPVKRKRRKSPAQPST